MAEYKVGRRATECAATNQPFAEGQDVVSAIFDGEDGFERRDYDAVAFADSSGGVEEPYSFWRARIPVAQEEQHRLDFDLALEFFARLVRDDEPEHMGLRFVLALLLGRKRRVKLKGFSKRDGTEYLNCVIRGDEEDEELSLEVPKLDEEGRSSLQSDLNRLFGVEETPVPEDVTPEDVAPEDVASEDATSEDAASADTPSDEAAQGVTGSGDAATDAATGAAAAVDETDAVGSGGDSAPL